jgi:hypothetical protein
MRFFTVIDFQHLVLGFFLGLAAALTLYLAFGEPRHREERKGARGEGDEEDYPEGLRARNHPVPLVLSFVYAGFAVWFIFYVIFVGLKGGPE